MGPDAIVDMILFYSIKEFNGGGNPGCSDMGWSKRKW
jgi:hypothetical protein